MAGGLLQLVAYGAQDVYLTGNPQITFFKVVYRRHTNFSIESIQQNFTGTTNFGSKATLTVARNGDLINQCFLQTTLPAITASGATRFAWIGYVGLFLIKSVELDIGGQQIDKHYGQWLYIWALLTVPDEKIDGFNRMVGNILTLTNTNTAADNPVSAADLYIPLQFWFCKNPGLALPLIALQYHEVKFKFEFETVANLTSNVPTAPFDATTLNPQLSDTSLYVDYIYLDTAERRRFAQNSHEYLIDQLQYTGDYPVTATTTQNFRLDFNHPTKEINWIIRDTTTDLQLLGSGDNSGLPILDNAKLQLNGQDRFSVRDAKYFDRVQAYQNHTASGLAGLYNYAFALKPEEHQPSGTLNFSRIDNSTLIIKILDSVTVTNRHVLVIYAQNYNVLRIMSGMGGLAYSN